MSARETRTPWHEPIRSGTVLPFIALVVIAVGSIPFVRVFEPLWQGEFTSLWEPRLNSAFLSSVFLAAVAAAAATTTAGLFLPLLFIRRTGRVLALALALVFCISPVVLLHGFHSLPGFSALSSFAAAAVVMSWKMTPISTVLLVIGARTLGRGELEAGRMAAPIGAAFRHLLFPRILPALLASLVMTFVLVFVDGELPSLVGYRNLPEEVLARITIGGLTLEALLPALPTLLLATGGAALLLALGRRYTMDGSWRRADLTAWYSAIREFPLGVVYAWLATGMILSPVFLVVGTAVPALPRLENGEVLAVINSCVFALSAALLAGFIGYLTAEGIAELRSQVLRTVLLVALCAQWLVPGYIPGAGMADLAIQITPWLDGDRLLVLTHALRVLPLSVFAFLALRWMERRSEFSAELAGISWWNRVRWLRAPVEWPIWMMMVAVLGALLLSELASTLLVVAPGTETAVLRIYNLMHYGAGDRVSLLALLQTAVVLIVLALATWGLGRMARWA